MSWRERFGMSGPPLPRGAAGETFFDQGPHFQRLARVFAWLAAEPGIGVVTGEPGVGKTSLPALSPCGGRTLAALTSWSWDCA